MGGVIPTEDEARRINAAVRAYEASATSRLTSRGHVPKKRVRIEPTVASPGSTTNTLNNCPCTSAPGVITPTVTAKFSHRQAYRWKRTGLMSMLNDIDGFDLSTEPVAVWNTDTPTNSYISADITRTIDAVSDVYVLTVTEDSTHGWKLNFSIKEGASPNLDDEIDWTEVCVSPNAPSPRKSNAVIVLDTETMTSEDGAYVDHPGCAGCLVPVVSGVVTICDEFAIQHDVPEFRSTSISGAEYTTSRSGFVLIRRVVDGANVDMFISFSDLLSLWSLVFSRDTVFDVSDTAVEYVGDVPYSNIRVPLTLPETISFTLYENMDGTGASEEVSFIKAPISTAIPLLGIIGPEVNWNEAQLYHFCEESGSSQQFSAAANFTQDGISDSSAGSLRFWAYGVSPFPQTVYPTGWPLTMQAGQVSGFAATMASGVASSWGVTFVATVNEA